MQLRRSIAIDGTGCVVLERGGNEFARRLRRMDISDAGLGNRSSSDSAALTLSRCASRTRSSPPTSAVMEIDFGAENVASHPARCSTLVTSFPILALVGPRNLVPDELLAGVGMLPLAQSREVFTPERDH
jgi:hypothetical protein